MPRKPNRNTGPTNQLRLNSKALFDSTLKDHNPIVIEDQDTNEDPSEFTNMEEMVIHTLREMPLGKTNKKNNKGHTSCVKSVDSEVEFTTGPDLKKYLVDTGPDPEHDFEETGPKTEHAPEKVEEETKLEAKGKMMMVHEHVKEIIDEKPKKNPRYEMRPRKYKLSIDLNRPTAKEEHGF
jgi:hypothetical protein